MKEKYICVHLNVVIAVHGTMCFPGKLSGTRGKAGTQYLPQHTSQSPNDIKPGAAVPLFKIED